VSAAFYCVADDRYFLGAVGLINSLRMVGHEEPIRLLDCGLTPAQRALVEHEVELIAAPAGAPPTLLKTIAPLAAPADTMVLIDTDMIVTHRFDQVLERAATGDVAAFRNDTDRYVPGWGEALDLGPVRRHPYVSFGMLAIGGDTGTEILRLLSDRQDRIDFDRTYWRERRITDYVLLYADQDVLNAILGSRFDPARLVALDAELAPLPPFDGVTVVDRSRLRCRIADGREPLVLHHWLAKPWLQRTHHGVYSQLLQRLLAADDVAIRVPPDQLPLRFRRGPLAFAERKRINARERIRWHVTEPLARARHEA
jgi:hypothetical protein